VKIKYTNILILLLVAVHFLKAQTNPHVLKQYPFVNYDSNEVKFFNEDLSFNHFYSKFDTLTSLGKGKLNILQIGGSHIQADVWSDQIRKNFQNISPNLNGGRGFIFPYKLAKTNNPHYYDVTSTGNWTGYRNAVRSHQSTFGVSGITATTTDSVSSFKLEFKKGENPFYDFNSIKVFHDMDSTSFCLELISDSCISIEVNREIGYTEFKFNNYQEVAEFKIYKTDSFQTHFNLYGLSLDNDDNGMVYTSIGVNGASTSSYLRNQLFVPHLKAINPDLVIFCIGINDAFEPGFCEKCFENNYDSLVAMIKMVNPNCEFLLVSNTDSYYKKKIANKRAFKVQDIMIKLAKKHRAGYYDLFTVMGGLGAIKTWQNNGLAQKDRVHLTKNGYILLGDLMFSALMKEYGKLEERSRKTEDGRPKMENGSRH
jgi:lysophospholipase L1-like esterase